MTKVFLADPRYEECSALKSMLKALGMEVTGEAGDWSTTLMRAPHANFDMLLIDEVLLSKESPAALKELRQLYPAATIILLVNSFDAGNNFNQGETGLVDVFVSRGEMPDCMIQRLVTAAEKPRKIDYLDLTQARSQ